MKRETMIFVRVERLKLSQTKLGDILGYTQRQICNIETGAYPVPKWMPYALAYLLNHGHTDPYGDM